MSYPSTCCLGCRPDLPSLSVVNQLSRLTRTREVQKPRWLLSTRRMRSSRTQNYGNGSITGTTRTIPWLNRVVILSKAEGSQVDIRSPSSSRVEERDSSSLMDPINLLISPCVPPNHFVQPRFPPSALPHLYMTSSLPYFVTLLVLPVVAYLSSSLHSSHV